MKNFFTEKEFREIGKGITFLTRKASKTIKRDIEKAGTDRAKATVSKDNIQYEVINDVKLGFNVLEGICFVQLAYLPKKLRGQGKYTKAMDTLKERYGKVLYEPTERWYWDNFGQPRNERVRIFFELDGVARVYLVWGTPKQIDNDFMDTYRMAIEVFRKSPYLETSFRAALQGIAFAGSDEYENLHRLIVLLKAKEEMKVRGGK